MSTANPSLKSAAVAFLVAVGVFAFSACSGPAVKSHRGKAESNPYWPAAKPRWAEKEYAVLKVALPEVKDAEFVNDDELCLTCHETYVKAHKHNVHRGQSCEKCHGPGSRHLKSRGLEKDSMLSFKTLEAPQRAELCLKCHEQDACSPGHVWRTSPHAHRGVSCTDCHTQHYNVPPGTPATQTADDNPLDTLRLVAGSMEDDSTAEGEAAKYIKDSRHLGAVTPDVCYRCHSGMVRQQEIAHPHQTCGAAGFDCTTCHNAHGKIREETRSDLCMKCHDNGSPTMAWHSSMHSRAGVACTDCHDPHPKSNVPRVVNISHTKIRRPKRLPMSVNEPEVCYKCHANVYAETSLPSHHPIKEGKMVCSDCHDGHGQAHGNLKEPTLNLLCYKCHADKQGPFVYEHAPVTENCGICHSPHGAVENNLMHQPVSFVCLRCHSGHRTGPTFRPHTAEGLVDVGVNPGLQQAFYSKCTQCHAQIHGSNLRSPHVDHAFFR